MQDIYKKIEEIKTVANEQPLSSITIDLMMDRTRELYDLLMHKKAGISHSQPLPTTNLPKQAAPQSPSPLPVAVDEPEFKPLRLSPLTTSLLASQKDLRSVIGINDKYQFVSELFHKDNSGYEEALNILNELEDMEEAILWMDNTIKEHYQWRENDDTLKLFMETLNRFYLKHSV